MLKMPVVLGHPSPGTGGGGASPAVRSPGSCGDPSEDEDGAWRMGIPPRTASRPPQRGVWWGGARRCSPPPGLLHAVGRTEEESGRRNLQKPPEMEICNDLGRVEGDRRRWDTRDGSEHKEWPFSVGQYPLP